MRVLNKYGEDFFPKLPMPWGSSSLYEKPKKVFHLAGARDVFSKVENPKFKYKQMLQEQVNLVERKRRIQAEAMAGIGEGQYQEDLELMKTDDFDSEEGDVFERVNKFEELSKRLE